MRSVSHPSAGSSLQSPRPAGQADTTQLPSTHTAPVAQLVMQSPQCLGSLKRSVSHPSCGLWLQSPNPFSQAPSWQDPSTQEAEACVAQWIPQAPQLSALVARLVSQPLSYLPSQSA